jgi:hypothetical protein
VIVLVSISLIAIAFIFLHVTPLGVLVVIAAMALIPLSMRFIHSSSGTPGWHALTSKRLLVIDTHGHVNAAARRSDVARVETGRYKVTLFLVDRNPTDPIEIALTPVQELPDVVGGAQLPALPIDDDEI